MSCLRQLEVLDTGIDPVFEQIVELARSVFNVPIVLVSLVDERRQWFKAWRGLEQREIEREHAFCNHTILSHEMLVVEDAHLDTRFSNNALVTGAPYIRFYAGCPLEMEDGLMAGSLCIIDRMPRVINERELEQLRMLGATTASLLKQHRIANVMTQLSAELARKTEVIDSQKQNLQTQKRVLDCASELAKMGAWELDCLTGELLWSDGMYAPHECCAQRRSAEVCPTPTNIHFTETGLASHHLSGAIHMIDLTHENIRGKRGEPASSQRPRQGRDVLRPRRKWEVSGRRDVT